MESFGSCHVRLFEVHVAYLVRPQVPLHISVEKVQRLLSFRGPQFRGLSVP